MEKNLTDISFIKALDNKFYGSRYTNPLQKNLLFDHIPYYDHFISPHGYEIIILPIYVNSDTIDKLVDRNFTVVRSKKDIYNQEAYIYCYKLKNNIECKKKYDIILMTLFYTESESELDCFYDYYRSHGVDHFFMYYNGNISQKNLPKYSNVTYISWNYIYWYFDSHGKKVHHAQIPAIIHFHKKYFPYSQYALMIDCDEFLHIDSNTTIKQFLFQNNIQNNLFTKHYWSKIDFESNKAYCFEQDPNRGKTILSSHQNQIDIAPSIHKYYNSIDSKIKLFHNSNKRIRPYNKSYTLIKK